MIYNLLSLIDSFRHLIFVHCFSTFIYSNFSSLFNIVVQFIYTVIFLFFDVLSFIIIAISRSHVFSIRVVDTLRQFRPIEPVTTRDVASFSGKYYDILSMSPQFHPSIFLYHEIQPNLKQLLSPQGNCKSPFLSSYC